MQESSSEPGELQRLLQAPAGSCQAQGNSWTTGSVRSDCSAWKERVQFPTINFQGCAVEMMLWIQTLAGWCGFLLSRYFIWLQVSVETNGILPTSNCAFFFLNYHSNDLYFSDPSTAAILFILSFLFVPFLLRCSDLSKNIFSYCSMFSGLFI